MKRRVPSVQQWQAVTNGPHVPSESTRRTIEQEEHDQHSPAERAVRLMVRAILTQPDTALDLMHDHPEIYAIATQRIAVLHLEADVTRTLLQWVA